MIAEGRSLSDRRRGQGLLMMPSSIAHALTVKIIGSAVWRHHY